MDPLIALILKVCFVMLAACFSIAIVDILIVFVISTYRAIRRTGNKKDKDKEKEDDME